MAVIMICANTGFAQTGKYPNADFIFNATHMYGTAEREAASGNGTISR